MDKDTLQFNAYLGDSVYVGYDGYHVWLYTDNGLGPTNTIALEPEVVREFGRWCERRNIEEQRNANTK